MMLSLSGVRVRTVLVGLVAVVATIFTTGLAVPAEVAGASPPPLQVGLSSTSASATEVAYQLSFDAPAALTTSSVVTVTAPAGTSFASGGCYYSIDDTRSTASAGCLPATTSAGGTSVAITINITASSGDPLVVTADGVGNPSAAKAESLSVTAGGKTLTGDYTLTNPTKVTGATFALSSTSATATAVSYTLGFSLTNGMTSDYSQFVLTAPTGTQFPTSGCVVTESDATTTQSAGCLAVDVTASGSKATVTAGLASGAGDAITLTVNDVTNPGKSGSESLSLVTTSDPSAVPLSYTLTSRTSVKDLSVSPQSRSVAATQLTYAVSFTATNGLTAGYSTLTYTPPAGVVLPQSTCGAYTVSDYQTTQSGGCPSVTVGATSVTVTMPINAGKGDNLTLTINGASNPTATGTGTSTLATSSDPASATATTTFTPQTSVGDTTFSSTTYASGAADASYTVNFQVTDAMTANYGEVVITAPTGTVFPSYSGGPRKGSAGSRLSPFGSGCGLYSDLDDNTGSGWNCPDADVSDGGGTVTVIIDVGARPHDKFTIVAHGVKNPKMKKGKKLHVKVHTSSDPKDKMLPFPVTAPTHVTGLTTTVTSLAAKATEVTYAATFKVTGGLDAGFSQIDLTAPTGAVFPQTSGCAPYEVMDVTDGQSGTCVTATVSSGENTVSITSPLDIRAGDEVTVVANGVVNPSAKESGSIKVTTTSDAVAATAKANIGEPNKVTDPTLVVSGMQPYDYTIGFVSTGGLTSGYSEITVVAASGAGFPSSSGCQNYTVTDTTDGQSSTCVTVSVSPQGNTAVITVPITIRPKDSVTVVADTVFGSSTPTSVKVSTTSNPVPVTASA